jgi:hypothetical protein
VSAGVVLVLCLGGVAAVGGLVVLGIQVIRDESQASVRDYLTALRDQDLAKAYGLRCEPFRQQVTLARFEQVERSAPRVTSFTVGTASVTSNQVTVPADLDLADGSSDSESYPMAQDGTTGAFQVCGGNR